jgi:hypothetical protein
MIMGHELQSEKGLVMCRTRGSDCKVNDACVGRHPFPAEIINASISMLLPVRKAWRTLGLSNENV